MICVIELDPDEEDNTTPFFQQQLKTIKSARYMKELLLLKRHT